MRKLLTIIITIAALGGAVILGYSALSKKTPPQATGPSSTILPYGTALDFNNLQDFNKTNRLFPYPAVTPPEIGAPTAALVP